ncbi:MAG: AMP-binding protein, partial [Pseudomonadota bacterium]
GAVLVSLNFRLAIDELIYVLADADTRLLIVLDTQLSDMADTIHERMNARERMTGEVIVMGGAAFGDSEWRAWLAAQDAANPNHVDLAADDELLQLYTSGTTGRPKGVVSNHHNLNALMAMNNAALAYRPNPGDTVLLIAPLFHIGGAGSFMLSINAGQHILLHQEFVPDAVLQDLRAHSVASVFMVPAMIMALLNLPDVDAEPFPALKQIYYGASPIAESVLLRAMQVFGAAFIQMYGMTESTGTVATLSAQDHQRAVNGRTDLLLSCGRPCVGARMQVVDSNGHHVPDGEVGEICIASASVMSSYYQLPEETDKTLRNGWLHTGDAGYRDSEGYFYLKDRIKDMVVSGGENIYPAEVENVLSAMDAIQEVAVIGVPCQRFGEALMTIAVLHDGASLSVEEMIAFCRGKIAGYKIPRQLSLLQSLPRNPSGKLLKTVLREPYWADENRNIG